MFQFIVFLALLFSILIAIFAVQNNQMVGVQFLAFHTEAAVSVMVLISAALGAAAMLLLGLAREVGARWRHRAVAQQLRIAQARVAELEAGAAREEPSAVSHQPSAGESSTPGTPHR
jgi:lipopolysaccharide assembly protein A